jgi:hypothetical protein
MRWLLAVGIVVVSVGCNGQAPTAPGPAVNPSPAAPRPPRQSSGPLVVGATSIAPGMEVRGVVDGVDPDCFPQWDSRGRCRAYTVIAPSDGELTATYTGAGVSRGLDNPELFLVAAEGSWSFTGEGWPVRRATTSVRAGVSYGVVVISYGPFPDAFVLRVDVQ